MNIEQITYLVEVDNQQSITKAANKLFVAQSTISVSISHLEKELNLILFKRSKVGVVPTEHGQIIIAHAKKILAEIEDIRNFALNSGNSLAATVKIASAPSFSNCILTNVIGELLMTTPEIIIDLRECYNNQVIDDLYCGQIDFGIIGYLAEDAQSLLEDLDKKSIHHEALYTGQLWFYLNPQHPLLTRNPLSYADVLQYPIITCKHLIKNTHSLLKTKPHFTELNNYENIKKIICHNDFIGILPDIFEYNDHYIETQKIMRLSDLPLDITVSYAWIRSLKNDLLAPERKIVELIKEKCTIFDRGA